jgi:hypothetical protein
MRAVGGLALGFLIILAAFVPARARDLRGVYVSHWPAEVAQLEIFGSGSALKGEFRSLATDLSQPDGIRRVGIPLKVFLRDARIVIMLKRPFLSTKQPWTAEVQPNGDLTVAIPEASGDVDEVTFYLVPSARAHRIATELLEAAARQKRTFDATDRHQRSLRLASVELTGAQRSLEKNRKLRRAGLERVSAAQTALRAAQARRAGTQIRSAARELANAKEALRKRDARIAELQAVVQRDTAILARR